MTNSTSHSSKELKSSMLYILFSCIFVVFAIMMLLGFISLFFPSPHSGKTDSEAQEDAFWELQNEADEGARKAQDYEREQKAKQAH